MYVFAFQDYFIGGIVYFQQEACSVLLSGCLCHIIANVSLGWIPISGLMFKRVNMYIVLLDIVLAVLDFIKRRTFLR